MAHKFSNFEISQILKEVEAAMVVKKMDRFRIRAYENAIATFDNMATSVQGLWKTGKLTDIPGVGANLSSHLDELFNKGKVRHFEQVKKGLPEGMFELLKAEGIGPRKAYVLAKEFQLKSRKSAVSKLIEAGEGGKIATLEGFGEKSQEQIINSLKKYRVKGKKKRMLLVKADVIVNKVMKYMDKCPYIDKMSPLGSFRRRLETVGDIDIGIATKRPKEVAEYIKGYPEKQKMVVAGEGVVRIIDENETQIDFKIESPAHWGSLLQHFTGSKQHNIALRELAIKQEKSMSEQGMKIKGKWVRFSSEEKFYQNLGLAWIPPEMRENEGEIELAKKNKLPNLIELKYIRGDLHTHSNYSWVMSHDSGVNKPEEIVKKAVKLGYDYVGIGDHNPSNSSYSDKQIITLLKARSEIFEHLKNIYEKSENKRVIKVFNTLEVDIKPDGALAIPRDGLKYLDFVTASVHSSFSQPIGRMTKRVLTALDNPKVKILGHPTGRLLEKRESFQLYWDEVFETCKKKGIAMEINANPNRLDLHDILVRMAIKAGVKLVINTDAHAIDHMEFMNYGLDVARRGWATKEDVVNTWPLIRFEKWIRKGK